MILRNAFTKKEIFTQEILHDDYDKYSQNVKGQRVPLSGINRVISVTDKYGNVLAKTQCIDDKQVPVAPKVKKFFSKNSNILFQVPICPSCRNIVTGGKWCSNCGQRIEELEEIE